MPTPSGDITTSGIWTEGSIDTKGYPVDLIQEVGDTIMLGGHSNEVAVKIIDLVVNKLGLKSE